MVDEIHHDYDSKLKEPRQTKLNEVYNIDKNFICFKDSARYGM